MKRLYSLLLGSVIMSAPIASNASLVVFDDTSDANYELAGAANTGNPDAFGPTLTFSDFVVTGGVVASNDLTSRRFDFSQVMLTMIDQDSNPGHGGLGVCYGSDTCSGSTDSLSSNLGNNSGGDEILFFNFGNPARLLQVFLNGEHKDLVDGDLDGTFKESSDALFNVFYSDGGNVYTSIFGNAGVQQQPTDLNYFDVNAGKYQYWAVAATGWGAHSSYVEALSYDVPEPSVIGLAGLGLLLIGMSKRKSK